VGDEIGHPPQSIFEKLVNKHAIKPKMEYPPSYFDPKALIPLPGGLKKN
jgi:hypothetical protein